MEHQHNNSGLHELKHSDYKIVSDEPDIEGWPIYNGQHDKIGKVHDLLFDPESRRVRYIVADLYNSEATRNDDEDDDNQVLIPIGMAELHETDDQVVLPGVLENQVGQFSPYPFDALRNNATAGSTVPMTSDNTHFNDEHFYRNRRRHNAIILPDDRDGLSNASSQTQSGIRLSARGDDSSMSTRMNDL